MQMSNVSEVSNVSENTVVPENTFEFSKVKYFGAYLIYKSLHSKAVVTKEGLTIAKRTKVLGTFPLKEKKVVVNGKNIVSLEIKKKMDIFDGILVGILSILGLMTIFTHFWIGLGIFGLAALCFFTGYGKVICIESNGAQPLIIATEGNQKEEEFVRLALQLKSN